MVDEHPGSGGEEAERGEPAGDESDDVFASLRLDDAFVKAATRSEPPARHRAPTGPVSPRPARRPRAAGPAAWIQRHRWVLYAVVIIAAVAVVAAVRHVGPFAGGGGPARTSGVVPPVHHTRSSVPTTSGTSSSGSSGSSASSTSTTIELESANYNPGDCVTWDQTSSGGPAATSVVPCTQPHLIEIVSKTHVPASVSHFPDDQGWINLARILCAQSVRSYLGYTLDPAGRFQINSINPTLAGWLQRDRTMWCGIGLGTPIGAPAVPFTGAVRGQTQELLYPVGTCLNFGGVDASSDTVACIQPHAAEVVGNASLASLSQLPQGATAFADAVQPECASLAAQYAGGSLPAGTSWAYLSLAQTSWDAGDRLVQCLIETIGGAGTPSDTTGSLQR